MLPVEQKENNNPIIISPVSHSKIELRLKRFGPGSRKGLRKLLPAPKCLLSFFFTIGFSQRTLRESPRAHFLPYGSLRSAQSFLCFAEDVLCSEFLMWSLCVGSLKDFLPGQLLLNCTSCVSISELCSCLVKGKRN